MASLDSMQIELLRRIGIADRVSEGELHDAKALMGADLDGLHGGWLEEAFQDFELLGFLSHAGRAGGTWHGRLSPQGRWFLEDIDKSEGQAA